MATTDRFPDLKSVRAERDRLVAQRDMHMDDLRADLDLLKDKEFRKALLMDTIGDALGSHTALGMVAQGVKHTRGWLPLIAPLLLGRRGILGSRMFWTALGFAVPALVGKEGEWRGGEVWDGLRSMWDKIRERFGSDPVQEEEDVPR